MFSKSKTRLIAIDPGNQSKVFTSSDLQSVTPLPRQRQHVHTGCILHEAGSHARVFGKKLPESLTSPDAALALSKSDTKLSWLRRFVGQELEPKLRLRVVLRSNPLIVARSQ